MGIEIASIPNFYFMEVSEAKLLLPDCKSGQPERWADLGSGSGTFTYALAEKLSNKSQITAIDRNFQKLKTIHHNIKIDFLKADFENDELSISNLNGILLANALHYVKDKTKLIQRLEKHFIKGSEKWIIVEYEHSVPNQWEPYPIPFDKLKSLFENLGYSTIEKIGERQSVYGGIMYSALITKT